MALSLLAFVAAITTERAGAIAAWKPGQALKSTHKPGCGPVSMVSKKQQQARAYFAAKRKPGAGMEPDSIVPFQEYYMDGFMMVGCVKDEMHMHADKFGDGKFAYTMGEVSNVSIVNYASMIPKEDQEPMTHDVCFAFCRSVPEMSFFGLINGRDCYCTPYYKQIAGDSSECDAVCEGNPTTMCGGMKKSSVFEMHSCSDEVANLAAAKSSSEEARLKLVSVLTNVAGQSSAMQSAATALQESFGQVGDPAATELIQEAKVFAGTLEHAAEDGVKLAEKMETMEGEAGNITGLEAQEKLTSELNKGASDCKYMTNDLNELLSKATAPEATANSSAELYYPAMYFVDKEFVEMPSTCGGKLAAEPLLGTYGGCAAACEAAVGKCVGFSYLASGGVCFLLSEVDVVTYYTGCGAAAFLQMRLAAAADTKCSLKLASFEGRDISPDPSGKCKGCLEKATKAARCFS